MLAFENNTAGAAGGSIYTNCFQWGTCQSVFQKTLGLPTESGQADKVYSFSSNRALGFGHDIATAPSALVLIHAVNQYVPGASNVDLSFSLLDAQGQTVVGSEEASISYLLQMLILPTGADCTTVQSCDRFKLQPTESFLSSGSKETTSLLGDLRPISLDFCQIGVEEVQVRLYVVPGDELDVGAAAQSEDGKRQLAMLQKTVIVTCRCVCRMYVYMHMWIYLYKCICIDVNICNTCTHHRHTNAHIHTYTHTHTHTHTHNLFSPCDPGYMRRETEGGLWTCVRCSREQYVVDPNKDVCEPCPAGAACDHGAFRPNNPADSIWNSTSDGIYRITSCPAGHVLIRDEAVPVFDRCVACAPDTYSVEEAVFGERLWDRSVENYNEYCHPCPRSRAKCSGANDVRPLAGALLMISSLSRYLSDTNVIQKVFSPVRDFLDVWVQ